MVILQKRVVGLNEDSLDRFVARAKRAAGLRGAVTILVTHSRELRRLNFRFRGKDKPTDVLSFPAQTISATRFAGDVAISADLAVQNARRLGHSAAEEVKILALHGVLHLAGYNHEADNGAMALRESRMRKQLGLPDALIERSEKQPTGETRGRGQRRSSALQQKSSTLRSESRAVRRRAR